MEENKQKKITIYSYSKVWKVEKKIYTIQNLVLPVPIDPWQVLYFVLTCEVFNMIFGVLPGVHNVPVVIRSMILPFLVSRFLLTKKLDGKNPIRYSIGIIRFLAWEQGKVMERFHLIASKSHTIKISWNCSEGTGG